MIDLDRYTSPRLNPSQSRGKERIRLILQTALQLFSEKGIDRTTTNDIAKSAGIPIGSVYRYFQNKEEIILAITDLQIDDVVMLFNDIAGRPDLAALSWQQTISLVTDTWAQHVRDNESFAFLYFLRCSHSLRSQTEDRWSRVRNAYKVILEQRNPNISDEAVRMYCQLTWSAVELAMSTTPQLSQRAVEVLVEHLDRHYPLQNS